MAFATIADLEARWRALTTDEQATAAALLDDAAALIQSTGITIDPNDENQAAVLVWVSCAMVKRAMVPLAVDMFGITQGTVSADVYSQTATYSNPSGDLYISKQEERALGIGAGFYGSIPARIRGWYGTNDGGGA